MTTLRVRELLEPAIVLELNATLADFVDRVGPGKSALVRSSGAWGAVVPQLLAGYPATRQIMDLPILNAGLASPEDAIETVLASGSEIIAVESEGKLVGCVHRRQLLDALAESAEPEVLGSLLLSRLMPLLLHDLANALAIVLGGLDRLSMGEAIDEPLAAAQVGAEHARTLLDRLRTLDAGLTDGPPMPIDLDPFFADLEPMLALAAGPNVELTVAPPNEPTGAVAYRRTLERVLTNIVLNAREAMPNGGRIRVSWATPTGARLQLLVEDDGPGIPADLASTLFDLRSSTRGRGRGLGMVSVRRSLARMGATIELVPSALGGAGFRIDLACPPGV